MSPNAQCPQGAKVFYLIQNVSKTQIVTHENELGDILCLGTIQSNRSTILSSQSIIQSSNQSISQSVNQSNPINLIQSNQTPPKPSHSSPVQSSPSQSSPIESSPVQASQPASQS